MFKLIFHGQLIRAEKNGFWLIENCHLTAYLINWLWAVNKELCFLFQSSKINLHKGCLEAHLRVINSF